MMDLFLNGLAASAGGGLTYLRNVVPHLAARADVHTTVAVGPELKQEFAHLPNIALLELNSPPGTTRRFIQEQSELPGWILRSGADVLISAGNFALRNSPVPQILLSRNSLYTSRDFFRDLRSRGEYGLWLDTRMKGLLARRSVHWADCTVAPSEAFAEELRQWTGVRVHSVHHGFDHASFFRDSASLPDDIQQKLIEAGDSLRLLFVSHYNYYRNFETLLRALPLLQDRVAGRKVRLFLTCSLRPKANPGAYHAKSAAALIQRLGLQDKVVELGTVPYSLLHHVYRSCDIYVTPAYAESFAHPLVEAMASGLPVVASGLAVHREICRASALYFNHFSAEELAARVSEVAVASTLAKELSENGRLRSMDFSWTKHVSHILEFARGLTGAGRLSLRIRTDS